MINSNPYLPKVYSNSYSACHCIAALFHTVSSIMFVNISEMNHSTEHENRNRAVSHKSEPDVICGPCVHVTGWFHCCKLHYSLVMVPTVWSEHATVRRLITCEGKEERVDLKSPVIDVGYLHVISSRFITAHR